MRYTIVIGRKREIDKGRKLVTRNLTHTFIPGVENRTLLTLVQIISKQAVQV